MLNKPYDLDKIIPRDTISTVTQTEFLPCRCMKRKVEVQSFCISTTVNAPGCRLCRDIAVSTIPFWFMSPGHCCAMPCCLNSTQ